MRASDSGVLSSPKLVLSHMTTNAQQYGNKYSDRPTEKNSRSLESNVLQKLSQKISTDQLHQHFSNSNPRENETLGTGT